MDAQSLREMPRPIHPAVVPEARPTPAAAIVRGFLPWAQRARAADRAAAASALARACLHADLPPDLRDEAAVALAALLDDPEDAVRRAMAEAFAAARSAPRALVVALACDRSQIAAPVLARSPLLSDAELVDCVAVGDSVAQCAVARRPRLGAGPAAALAEVGTREAALALVGNPRAELTRGAVGRIFERFAKDADVRDALARRPDLPANLKAEIAIASAGDADVSPARRTSREATLASIAAACADEDLPVLVRTLRGRGALTMALLLRSLLGGDSGLFAAALADLAGLPAARAVGLVRDPQGAGLAVAAVKAGLPAHAVPVFRAALRAIATCGRGEGEPLEPDLVGAVIAACERRNDPALAPYLAVLWRFAAEAARSKARAKARAARARLLPPSLDFSPVNDDETEGRAPPVELPADLVLALNAA